MHIIESMASVSRLKIDKPVLLPKFFPISFDKYITFHASSKFNSRQYDWWGEVLILLKPYLNQAGIKIVQIGGKEDAEAAGVDLNLCGQVSYRQTYDVIQKAKLHLGCDSFPIHVASVFGTKIVGLYSNMYKDQSKPYWSDPKDTILLQAPLKGRKPSYSANESSKTINFIKPEEIAKSVLKLLNIDHSIDRGSFYFGDKFTSAYLESIPDCLVDAQFIPQSILHVRYDYVPHNDITQSFLYNQISIRKCVIITDKLLNEVALQQLKPNIVQVIIKIIDENQINIVNQIEKLGIPYILLSDLSDEEINKLKLTYLDHTPIMKQPIFDKSKLPAESLKSTTKYKVSKLLLSQNKVFASKAHWQQNKDCQPFSENILGEFIDNIDFWNESEFLYLYN